jgi:hypothetical protein
MITFTAILAAAAKRRNRSSYIVSEDFEGTGAPEGWTNQNGVGTVNFDNTGTPSPQGGQNLYVNNNTISSVGSGAGYILPAPMGTFGYYAQMRCGNSSANRAWYFTDRESIYFRGGTGPAGNDLLDIDTNAVITGLFANFTWYHIWLDRTPTYKALYVSTDGIKPGSPITTRTGTFSDITKLVSSFNNAGGVWLDKVRLSTSPIGSNPV